MKLKDDKIPRTRERKERRRVEGEKKEMEAESMDSRENKVRKDNYE